MISKEEEEALIMLHSDKTHAAVKLEILLRIYYHFFHRKDEKRATSIIVISYNRFKLNDTRKNMLRYIFFFVENILKMFWYKQHTEKDGFY